MPPTAATEHSLPPYFCPHNSPSHVRQWRRGQRIVEPSDTQIFSLYGVTDFTVQGWDGANWVALGTVGGTNLVKRTVNFPPYTTDRIRINITNALGIWSRITELEAWGN
jgi:hypothetical protein